MSESLASRYAGALFALSLAQEKSNAVLNDMTELRQLLQTSVEITDFVDNPSIPSQKKQSILTALFQDKIDSLTLTFMLFLQEKNRLDILAEAAASYELLHDRHHGRTDATLTSAVELADEQINVIQQRLEEKWDKHITLTTTTDPQLIGGFIIRIDDQVIDLSLKNQLQQFKDSVVHA